MKIHLNLNSLGAPSSHAAHKALQTRTHSTKATTHRYERRKVREILRHGDEAAEIIGTGDPVI